MSEGSDIEDLLSEASFVGGIFEMGYETCKIHTSDYIKRHQCGGLPKHSFLLARMDAQAGDEDSPESEEDTEPLRDHALLLRVTGPADLPIHEELTSARHRNIEERLVEEVNDDSARHELDAYTQQELQKTAFEAEILGTFYTDEDGQLAFGSDAHTIFPSGEYLVYKPTGAPLSEIASYLAAEEIDEDDLIDIGEVRYASTRLRPDPPSAPVAIDTTDLIGAKTAVFGMTRTGKSNTLKVIAAAVSATKDDVGQLVFDPSGEYTPNEQDPIALSEITDDVSVFKYAADEDTDDVIPLGTNFLDPNNVPAAQQEARQLINSQSTGDIPQYATGLIDTTIPNPGETEYDGDYGQRRHDRRNLAAFHAVLVHDPVNLTPHDDWSRTFPANNAVKSVVDQESDLELPTDDDGDYTDGDIQLDGDHVGQLQRGGGRVWIHDPEALDEFWTAVADNTDAAGFDDDDEVTSILEMISTSYSGTSYLSELDKFHEPGDEDSQEQIYDRLADGELVIVDMTNGEEDVVSRLLRQTVEYIMDRSVATFNDLDADETLPDIQIFLEEAHRYFSEDRFQTDDDSPYVRLAKEGAKYQLGLVYATQEVSVVDDRVLSNTANWIVTHLNSESETSELSDYYDFDVFDRTIRRVQDKGFARVRTDSNAFTVPTQIYEFDRPWIEETVGDVPAATESQHPESGD